MTNKNLLILGAGQYGQVAKEIAEETGYFDKIAFLDDNSEQAIGKIDEYEDFVSEYSYVVVAIGNAELRLDYIQKLEEACYRVAVLVSPRAYISKSAPIDERNDSRADGRGECKQHGGDRRIRMRGSGRQSQRIRGRRVSAGLRKCGRERGNPQSENKTRI